MKQYTIKQYTAAEFDAIDEYPWNDDEIVIIEKKDAYCMDITANGKRIVPILRKIEEAMTAAGLAGDDGIYAGWFGEWANELTDRRDRKNFIWDYSGRSDRERGCWSYSWGIEQVNDDQWYIFLNIAKPTQEETEEYTEEEAKAIKVGESFVNDFPHASRFDIANMIHGYNPELTFDQLTAITREISFTFSKPAGW